MQKSLFIISLDFELFWGVRDKRTIKDYGANILGVRKVIPALLDLFQQYGVNATFATVGFLFASTRDELLQNNPAIFPQYGNPRYSPYENNYLQQIGNSEAEDLYHYGASLIREIIQDSQQEIASHTYSHYYCLENASLASFEADIVSGKKIAGQHGIDLKTMVFPRNQYSADNIAICKKLGFIAYRGNEKSAIYNPRKNEDQNKSIRAVRLADSYLNLTGHHTFSVAKTDGMVNIPASRFLRPYSPRLSKADGLRLRRIKKSMTFAAKNKQAFHLWWHPHNFGIHLEENLSFLKKILEHYQQLHQEYGMMSKTMSAVAEEILQPYAF